MALPDLIAYGRLTPATRRLAARALCLGGALVACGEPAAPIDDDTYVLVMARLSYANARFLDVASIDSARRVVLEETGVDPADLLAFAEVHGADTGKMFTLHERIRDVVDSLDAVESGVSAPEDTLIGEPGR